MVSSDSSARQDAEDKYKRAAGAELAKDFDQAFRFYIGAAEQFLHLSRQAVDDRVRAIYKGEAAKSLERAEKIKSVRQDLKPVAKDEFSQGEQLYTLQKSSLINQGFFPLWDSPDPSSSPSEQPPLSAEQIEYGATWQKAPAGPGITGGDACQSLDPQDIVQHIVSDCSVCGAMVVAIDHHRRFGSNMIISALYPQDDLGLPTNSDTRQYAFKILYNGADRRIIIDDQLPSYPDGTLMCVSTGETGQLWPSLVEKAYMKLAGGYDFLGSDSSTDLHALAGWIPEVLDMKGPHFQREKTWNMLAKGYTSGSCVATLGTGEQLRASDILLTLLPTHCYAIIGVHDSEEDRRLNIFDPWIQSDRGDGVAEETSGGKSSRTTSLSIDSVYQIFDGIYFSWNPAMFKHKLAFHGMWKRDGKGSDMSTHFRTQVQLDNADIVMDEEVWILLTRHVRSHRAKDEFIAITAHTESAGSSLTGLGADVLSTKGEYTNLPHILVKASTCDRENLIALVASYEGERDDVGFTLTVYSNHKATWAHMPQKLLYSKEITGAFTQKTSGGNHTYPTYYLNPQYHLHVHPKTGTTSASRDTKAVLSVTASTDRHIPVNIMLAWSQGARINELAHNDLALSSGAYSYGYAHATGRIPPGDYTLILSPFEPRHLGQFTLNLHCSDRFDLTPIHQEGAGMFSKVVRGEWAERSAGGGPSSGKYASNPIYELNVPSPSQLKLRLQLAEPSPSIALNVTIFNTSTSTTSTLGRHIATSGPYSDAISGVFIEKVSLQPGKYLVVPSTYKPGVLADFKLIVYSTVSGVQLTPPKQ